MKKKFETPAFEIIEIQKSDIMTTSFGGGFDEDEGEIDGLEISV